MIMDLQDITDEFESAMALLVGAEIAKQRFDELLQNERGNIRGEFVTDGSMVEGLFIHRFSFTGKPSTRLRKLAYDALNDCRHALDQATVAANSLLGVASKSFVYFPSAENEADFDSLFASKGRCRNVHPALVPELKGFQPWWEDDSGTGNDVLRTLMKLAGPNKHQVIIDFPLELKTIKNNVTAVKSARFLSLPPVRRELGAAQVGIEIPAVRGRTDFIAAITDKPDDFSFDFGETILGLYAREASRFPATPFPDLLGSFVKTTKDIVFRIENFVLNEINP